jgi:hypothetical protein
MTFYGFAESNFCEGMRPATRGFILREIKVVLMTYPCRHCDIRVVLIFRISFGTPLQFMQISVKTLRVKY